MGRPAMTLPVLRRGAQYLPDVAKPPGNQRLVGDLARAYYAIYVVRDQVDGAVAYAEVQLDVGYRETNQATPG